MIKQIQKLDKINCPESNGHNRFYKYYTKYRNELCEVIVAVRHYRKKWYCKQVVVHGIYTDKVWLRDICLTMGCYHVGWYRDGISKSEHWFDYDWGTNDAKYFNIYAEIVNKDYILTLPEYKYSAVNLYIYNDVLKYLKAYEQYPQTELLLKVGLTKHVTSKLILRQCAKDKQFCKWLSQHIDEANKCFYITSLIKAYKQKRDIREIDLLESFKRDFDRSYNYSQLKEEFKKEERKKFFEYLIKQNTDFSCYLDYLEACKYLNLDMSLDKNRYPHDFKRWHDIRIDEYQSEKAKADKKVRRALYNKFKKVANKFVNLQHDKQDLVVLIAKSPAELIREGALLHHCVGRMGYDQKFAKEESLIFFLRHKNDLETPYVTFEYSLKHHTVLQCYGDNDSKPDDNVLNFVNKIWLPYANRKIKKIA